MAKSPAHQPSPGKTTLADVAALAGVSLSTVSRAIHKRKFHERLSKETIAKVEAAAQKLNYHAHHVAQTLATNRSMVIGIYVHTQSSFIDGDHPTIGIGYAGDILAYAEAFFRAKGYDLLLINLSDSNQQALEHSAVKFHSRQVDGILMIGCNEPNELSYLHKQSIPAVAVDYAGTTPPPISHVSLNNQQAIYLAVDHLVGLGHKNIAFLGACHEDSFLDCHIRHRAFIQRMAHHELPVAHDMNWPNTIKIDRKPDFQFFEGCWAADYILAKPEASRPTALITISDSQAYAAVQHLSSHGIRCPQDLSVIGFDNSIWARWASPALTSASHQLPEMTTRACEILLTQIQAWYEGNGWELVQEKVESSLVVRNSTGPAPKRSKSSAHSKTR